MLRRIVYKIAGFSLIVQGRLATAFAQGKTGAEPTEAMPLQPSFSEMLLRMTPMLIMVYLVFYIMVIRPQQKKQLAQESLLNSLKKGDQVVTFGGIIGKVASIADDHVVLDVGANTKVKFRKSKIVEKLENKTNSKKEEKHN